MALPSPQGLLDAFMWQRGHSKAGMGDAEPGHFLGEYNPCSFYCLSFSSRLGAAAGTFKACSCNQLVYLTHWQPSGSEHTGICNSDFTDKAIRKGI